MTNMVYVEIRKKDTDEVVKKMGPMAPRKAERVSEGASINLNHEEYYVVEVEAEECDSEKK